MSEHRPSWHKYFMDIAIAVSMRATCDRKRVGAVIVRSNHVISTGYNSALPGLDHCDDVGHDLENNHCRRVVHAEANAICHAARHGITLAGATLYTTASPCWDCFKLAVQAGITHIYYSEFYRDKRFFEAAEKLGLAVVHFT